MRSQKCIWPSAAATKVFLVVGRSVGRVLLGGLHFSGFCISGPIGDSVDVPARSEFRELFVDLVGSLVFGRIASVVRGCEGREKMFESVPRWARVSAVIVGVAIGQEVLYEVYLGWRSYCEQRRARQRATTHINEVYFTNERNTPANAPGLTMASFTTEHVSRIVALLDRARVSINLGMYIITVSSIGDALLQAANRGVRVRVVGCSSMAYSTGSQMTRLANAGKTEKGV